MAHERLFDIDHGTPARKVLNMLEEARENLPSLVFDYPPIAAWDSNPMANLTPEEIWKDSDVYSHNIYIHIPFCRQKCSFCYYSVTINHKRETEDERIWDYLRALKTEALRYREIFRTKKIGTVFIGGGTPSRLDPDQIEYLFSEVIGLFDLSECYEITFEGSADSFDVPKLKKLKEHGVRRLSMGVQSFAEDILRATRRTADTMSILDTYNEMAASGIPVLNIDLIAGVELESESSFLKSVEIATTLERRPSQITMFTLNIREGALNFVQHGLKTHREIYENSLRNYKAAKKIMLERGYWQYSRNLFPTGDNVFRYQDNIWGHNGYVLALGCSGYSHSQHYVYMNRFKVRDYTEAVRAGETTIDRGFWLSPTESIRRYLVLAMKHKRLDKNKFLAFKGHTQELLNLYKPIFDALVDFAVVTETPDAYEYTGEGIDEVDKYVRLFYSRDVNREIVENLKSVDKRSDAFAFTK